MKNKILIFLAAVSVLCSCTAPRNIIESGKVTPKKHVRGGIGTSTYLPTAFSSEAKKAIEGGIEEIGNDTLLVENSLNDISSALLSYGLDPLTQTFDLYLRYGIADNLDAGYKFTGGAHVIDVQYQIAGSQSHNHWNWGEGFSSSLALQYSGQSYKLPSIAGDIHQFLGFEMQRRDVMLKFLNSISLGEEEEIGHFGFGLAYNHSFLSYGLDPSKALLKIEERGGNKVTEVIEPVPHATSNYGGFGLYTNIRVGYKYAYFYASFSVFYQQYGSYSLFEGHEYNGGGFTFIPSLGLQFDI